MAGLQPEAGQTNRQQPLTQAPCGDHRRRDWLLIPQSSSQTDGLMPLTRSRDSYLVREHEIAFLMRDGEVEIICQIDLAALSQLGNTADLNELIEIFRRERTRIERAASQIYDRTSRRDYEILVVRADDLA